MFSIKLLGLALSTLMSITPFGTGFNNYQNTEITFPFTRTNYVSWKSSVEVYDMGPVLNNEAHHDYAIKYHVDMYCSSACTIENQFVGNNFGYNIDQTHLVYDIINFKKNLLPNTVLDQINTGNKSGLYSASATYANENSYIVHAVTIQHQDGSWTVNVGFPALTEAMITSNVAFWTEQVYWVTLANALRDTKDIPSSVMQQFTQYINDGDYSQAIEYISNYYETTNVTNNEETLQVINDYDTKETTLNNYYNTENNFTNQVETDFQNQEQQLPDINSTIQEMQVPKFLQSANWVTAQFNRLTTSNALGSLITFSLLTGFILALIGRFKR